MPEPVRIFLSYAHADGDGVGRIYQQLKDRGYKPWADREDILGGGEWEPAIRTGIREADLFLLCMARHSLLRRGVLQKEIRIALDVAEEKLDTDIFLIPVWIQVGVPLPKEEMPDRLSRLQWINLPEADGWRKLIRSIEHQSRRLGRDSSSSPLATRDASAGSPGPGLAGVEQLVGLVRTALQASDPVGVQAAAASIVEGLHHRSHGFTAQHGTRVVSQLWRKHLVALVQYVSDASIQAGIDAQPI
jgi:TIR domain